MDSPQVIGLRMRIGYCQLRASVAKTDHQMHWWLREADRVCGRIIALTNWNDV